MTTMADKLDEEHAWILAGQFHVEFRDLVRRYLPTYPETDLEASLHAQIQDKTSCFSPYIWADDYVSPTDRQQEMEKAIRTLQKDNARLREALADAQEMNAGLERDKDNAHMLFQLLLDRQPGQTFLLTHWEMRKYNPRQWYVERVSTPTGAIRYKLKGK